MNAKKLTMISLLIASSVVIGYLEFLFLPSIYIPGIKLGLSNICVLITIYLLGRKAATFTAIVKCLMSALLFSGVYGLVYGFPGIILSLLIMCILYQSNKFSIMGISIAGAIFHNIGQLVIALIIAGTVRMIYYGAFLIIGGLFSGIITGCVSEILIKRLKGLLED